MKRFLHSIGKKMRFRRLIDHISSAVIAVPLDHGYTLGSISGIQNLSETVDKVYKNGASCVIVQKGMVRILNPIPPEKGFLVHLSGSVGFSIDHYRKISTGTIIDALYVGADGVSIHVNVGGKHTGELLENLSQVTSLAEKYGMPVFAMMYVESSTKEQTRLDNTDQTYLSHLVRIAEESGADIVKIGATSNGENFEEVVQGATIPVVIAGGAKEENFSSFLSTVENCILSGASGVSVGRNIFGSEDINEAMKRVTYTVRRAIKERGYGLAIEKDLQG